MNKKKFTHFWETEPHKALFHQPFGYWEKNDDWNKDIPQYFQRLNKINDDRSFVILASTVLEYQVDRLLMCFIPEYQILIKPNTSFDFKLNIVRAFRLLPPQIINSAELIKNIRNEFAHNQDLDNFTDVTKSKTLKEHTNRLDKIWKKYEADMVYYKLESTYLKKFKDVWRKALEGFRSYEKNITFFRHITEKKEFINNLEVQSKELEVKRVKIEREQFIKQKIRGR